MKTFAHFFSKLKSKRLPLRIRLALWSAGLTFILSFFLLFFINIVALSSFPTIIRSTSPSSVNNPQHNSQRRQLRNLFENYGRPLNPVEIALLRELQSISLMGLGVLAICSGAGAYLIAGQALRPIRRVREAAQMVSASTLHTRLALDGPKDEVKDLADTFDAMLGRLENNFNQQSRFVADVAHELRTPLASLRTNMEVVITDNYATVQDYREMAEAQERALTRLEHLVSDLLMLAKSEQSIQLQTIDLIPLAEEVFCDLEHEATQRCVLLELLGDDEVLVLGNGPLLTRVISNLVANAICYNRPGGRVEVAIEHKEAWAIVRVTDTGVGIEAEQQEHIFDRFYRIDTSRARHTGGAGLGLSIVSAIVRQHNGKIQVESVPGAGSTFTVLLPYSPQT